MNRFAAILFDYNGTLFFDADINEWAWRQTINEMSKGKIDFDEIYGQFRSTRNAIFVAKVLEMLKEPADEETVMYWAKRKETRYYHTFCREHNRRELSPGAEELLNYLKENGFSINLCTASLIENVDFYFEWLDLGRWFDKDIIAYDDGTFLNKTDMYQTCARRVGTDLADCLVIEDSANSISEARKGGCHNFVAIRKPDTPQIPEILQVIDDFTQFDYSLLER